MKKAFLVLVLFAATATASSLLVLSGSTPTVSAWAPTTPSNTLRWWIKADAIAQADSTTVQTWTASAGPNATQATSGSRPTYLTNIQNGMPVVRFDGVDDWMATAAFSSAQAQPYTALIIFRIRNTGVTMRLWDGIADPGRFLVRNDYTVYAGTQFADMQEYTNLTSWKTLYIVVNGASTTMSWNGAANLTVFATPGSSNVTGMTLGANMGGTPNPAEVDIMEFIIWDGSLSAGDKTSALAYARTRGATW